MGAVGLGLLMVLGVYPMRVDGYSVFGSTAYAALFRIGWSVALGWVIFACVHGHGGFINSFLSWGLFTSLSRLTYFTYLIHLDIIAIFFTSLTFTEEFTPFLLVRYSTLVQQFFK